MSGGRKAEHHEAQAALMRSRSRARARGAVPFGWKIGINDPRAQRFYGLEDSVVGYMTQESLIRERRDFDAGLMLVAEPELAIRVEEEVRADADAPAIGRAIGAAGPAVEILNFDQPRRTLREVMEHDIFHLGVCIGEWKRVELAMQTFVECRKNGELTSSVRAPKALPPLERIVGLVARTLAEHGEALVPGDVIISGAMTPAIPLEPGHELTVAYSGFGRLSLRREIEGSLTVAVTDTGPA